MQSTKAYPDRSRNQYPSSKDPPSPSEPDDPLRKTLDKNETAETGMRETEEVWQPRFDRRSSWSNQDRKHELQGRLLNVEGSRERGFTEVNRG